jgi:uncharacterized protein (DUF1330 family)
MPAYVIFIRESPIHNPAAMEEYAKASRANPPDPKLTVKALYGQLEALEGKCPDGVVVLEFPTFEDAKTWYYGPYQEAAKHRRAGADYRGFIVDGFKGF